MHVPSNDAGQDCTLFRAYIWLDTNRSTCLL